MAHDAFVAALNWRQAVCMASHLQFDDTHMADTARSLAGQCILWPFSFSLYSDTVCPLKACFTKSEQCAFGISIACVTILDFIRKFTGWGGKCEIFSSCEAEYQTWIFLSTEFNTVHLVLAVWYLTVVNVWVCTPMHIYIYIHVHFHTHPFYFWPVPSNGNEAPLFLYVCVWICVCVKWWL